MYSTYFNVANNRHQKRARWALETFWQQVDRRLGGG